MLRPPVGPPLKIDTNIRIQYHSWNMVGGGFQPCRIPRKSNYTNVYFRGFLLFPVCDKSAVGLAFFPVRAPASQSHKTPLFSRENAYH